MAWETNVGLDVSFAAASNLSTKQFYFVLLNSSKKLALCAAAASESFLGVLQNDPNTDQVGEVRTGGVSKVACGGTFDAGDLLASDSAGKAVKYTKATVFTGTPYVVSGSSVLGVALEGGLSGQLAAMLVSPRGLSN